VIRPKYVHIRETDGLWRLDQQITERGDHVLASVATVELQARPRLVIVRKNEDGASTKNDKDGKTGGGAGGSTGITVIKQPYTFTKKKLSGSYQTQFVAPAFLVGDNEMRVYGYRGTWQRKLADKSVIKLVGKIYQVHKQRFGKHRGEYVFGKDVGTFVMRRRIRLLEDDKEEDDEDDRQDEEEGDEYDDDDDDEDDDEWEEVDDEVEKDVYGGDDEE
jgi:hypothetical protein